MLLCSLFSIFFPLILFLFSVKSFQSRWHIQETKASENPSLPMDIVFFFSVKKDIWVENFYIHKIVIFFSHDKVRFGCYTHNTQVFQLPHTHHNMDRVRHLLKRDHRCPYSRICVWDSWDISWVKFVIAVLWEMKQFLPPPTMLKCLCFF